MKTDTPVLTSRGLRLEYATLGWNVVGCWIVLLAAYTARSVALAGFGIDSVIEIFASLVVIWQLKSINKDKEYLAERLIGIASYSWLPTSPCNRPSSWPPGSSPARR